ncbi:hypothetical protein [Aeromonas sp. 600479]|uniref:hypothetical protein n=1 Tax=Aeromonas sp. 600479 TaxID=2712028 RepID=UPI003BA2F6A3
MPASESAQQGDQCQLDPLGVINVGLLEEIELGRIDGVILHIDEGTHQERSKAVVVDHGASLSLCSVLAVMVFLLADTEPVQSVAQRWVNRFFIAP